MNDMTFTHITLDSHRAADLARESEMLRMQADRGVSALRAPRRSLGEWFRDAAHHSAHRAPAATIAPSH
jgi:hypothetical protein